MKAPWKFAAAAAGLALALAGCKRQSPPAETGEAARVAVMAIEPETIQDVVELDGSVAPSQQVNLVARVAGTLDAARFEDGGPVRAGQLLFVIEQSTYAEQLKLNQAKLVQAQADYRRQIELQKQNANAQANVETSLSNLQQAQANAALAKINLNYTEVKAPFDGVIGRRQVDPGNYVGATTGGTVLATMMQLSPAFVNASIGERDALQLRDRLARVGLAGRNAIGRAVVHARLQGDPVPGTEGVLDFLDHQENTSSGTITVRGRFANADYHLIPGFYAQLSIDAGPPRQALVLSRDVVMTDQLGDYVYVAGADSRAHRRTLSVANLPGERVEVTSGLQPGERVIVQGSDQLTDGQTVAVAAAPGREQAATP